MIRPDIWTGCYLGSWKDNIVPEAFSHPAKVSFSLAGKIYAHALKMGWVEEGSTVLDPFGGIGGFAFHALINGLNWIGVELEQKFVDLGQQNIELWKRKFRNWPKLGTARLVQGDSRKLFDVLYFDIPEFRNFGDTDLIISSPPFCEIHQENSWSPEYRKKFIERAEIKHGKGRVNSIFTKHAVQSSKDAYGHTPGNLANMKEGSIDAVMGSPPYCETRIGQESGQEQCGHQDAYSRTSGQLGSMKEGAFDACISSPPYEESQGINPSNGIKSEKPRKLWNDYSIGTSKGQLGNISRDTFWSASREIVQGCFDLLKPGGHAIWVTKRYIKAGKIVEFSQRWATLCESVGFKLVCWHHASLVQKHGTQGRIFEEDEEIQTERKSFFRRLAERKGSPRIDHEDIICMEKI